jgi:uncharacterized protein (TIGR03437 family)
MTALSYRFVKTLLMGSAAALLLHADANGPEPGLAGVPNEVGTCANCHASGASSINTKGGKVSIAFPNGNTYVPGEVQHWIVTVTDSSARRWGYQATARRAAGTSTVAGGFKASNSFSQVICSDTGFRRTTLTTSGACTTSSPMMYIEHTAAGTRLGTTGSVTFEFDWTAPSSDVGPVNVYIAANAANGNNQDDTGDHVYTANYTLNPAAAASGPAITSVVNGASFAPGIAAGSWVAIQGQNLSATTRTWTADDFKSGTPTSLDGVSVSFGGRPGYVYYVSPTQINVQAPDLPSGTVAVTVTTSSGSSAPANATVVDYAPAFFLSGQYAIATHQDGTLVAPAGLIGNSSPAARGETVVLWGTGFGVTSPSVPAGETSSQAVGSTTAYVALPPSITIGGVTATVVGAALNPGALGLYQIAVTVPSGAASGDQPLVADSQGATSPSTGVLLSVK